MSINKKAIAVKLSKTKSKNGFVLYRLKDGTFQWKKLSESKPWWTLGVIV